MNIDQLKMFVLERRNISKAKIEDEAIKEDGYFNAREYSGGNFDDYYIMGKECGEAQFIEELISLFDIRYENIDAESLLTGILVDELLKEIKG